MRPFAGSVLDRLYGVDPRHAVERSAPMKLLPVNTSTRVNTEDSLGHGMDAVIMLAIFLLGGYGLDRLFGTMPIFMIVMTMVGSVGLFYKFKASYSARMDELEAQRRGPAATNAANNSDADPATTSRGSGQEAAS